MATHPVLPATVPVVADQHMQHKALEPPPLTRADVREEVAAALKSFAEDALRRELETLSVAVRAAVAEAQATLTTAKEPCQEAPPARQPWKPRSLEARLEGLDSSNTAVAGQLPLRREDMHAALEEWWATHKLQIGLAGMDAEHRDRKVPVQRQHSNDSTIGGNRCRTCASTDCDASSVAGNHSGPGTSASTDCGAEVMSPPLTPAEFSLPPAVIQEPLDVANVWPRVQMTPLASPLMLPHTPPATPLHVPFFALSSSSRDWRRNFVQKAFKANRKIEFTAGSQCRETAEVSDVIEEAIRGLEDGIKPLLVEDGLGGTYFMKDRDGVSIAVFKPRDEEPMAPNNPKVHAGEGQGEGLKQGVLVGEAAISEFAAFMLDQVGSPKLRAGVCPTALVCVANSVFHSATEGRHSPFRAIKDKVGSFQLFAQHDCTSEDLGPGKFPDDQVHRLAILDIRLCNTDRHSGNILVRQKGGEVELIPIDHGYALPGEIGNAVFEWLAWPAARRPFGAEMRREILAIDPSAVESCLRRKVPALRDERFLTLRTCTVLLQCGVRAGLTAFDIGGLMTRPEDDDYDAGDSDNAEGARPKLSVLEELVVQARSQVKDKRAKPDGEEPFEKPLENLIRERCEQLAQERMPTP